MRRPRRLKRACRLHARASALPLLLTCFALAGPLQSCKRKAAPRATEKEERTEEASGPQRPTATPIMRRILAAWYRVPERSLAKRRAAPDELTAAHNSLPIGTRVRVTNPDNGRSVIVRITDRGIHDRRVNLDLCKEAAAELQIVQEGFAHLRMQVLGRDGEGVGDSQAVSAND